MSTSGAAWLLVATLLGLISSIKLVAPGFLGIDWLNYGRSQPAFLNALLYGWAEPFGGWKQNAMYINRLELALASAVAFARQNSPENASGFAGRRAKNA